MCRRALVVLAMSSMLGCAGFDFGMKTSADRKPEPAAPPKSQWPAQRPAPEAVDRERSMTVQTSDRDRAEAMMRQRCPDGFEVEDLDYRDSETCSRPVYPLPRRGTLTGPRCEPSSEVVVRFRCERAD